MKKNKLIKKIYELELSLKIETRVSSILLKELESIAWCSGKNCNDCKKRCSPRKVIDRVSELKY
jgi:hypothetical protein